MLKRRIEPDMSPEKNVDLPLHLKRFRKFVKHPENFVEKQKLLAKKLKLLVKGIYDNGTFTSNDGPVPYLDELVAEDMDEEQIWQQLELKNDYFIEQDLKNFSEVLSKNEKRLQLQFTTQSMDDDGSVEEGSTDEDDHNGTNGNELDSQEENYANGMDSEDDERPKKVKKQKKKDKQKAKVKQSIVDDRFFKLDDMARFLDQEDEREMRRQKGVSEKNPLIEIDYFDEHTGENDEDSEEDIKYADFFDDDEDTDDDNEEEEEDDDDEEQDGAGEEDDEDAERSEEESDVEQDPNEDANSDEAEVERNRKLRYEIYKGEGNANNTTATSKSVIDQPDSSDSEDGDEPADESAGPKSSYEIRQEKMRENISKLESKLLLEKPWQLKGEISAEIRPQNSLLEEVLEYEHTTRTAPVISEETTMRLEDIILQRVRNKAFDDVEQKRRPPENPREYRKELVLDGEKSKESLAQVYEQDYLKQLEKANPDGNVLAEEEEEPKEHKEIRRMMKTVLAQLDALSNFHYTPRPAAPELKILTNTPAISMEEVAPVATSDANLLAPEEVHRRPKGDVMSKDERTRTDQNRERRSKKRFQQQKFRREAEREQKQLEKAGNADTKQTRALQTSLLKKVTKAKNVQQMAETSSGPAKSSSAFFSQLQDELRTQVKAKADGTVKKKKKNTENVKASSLKL